MFKNLSLICHGAKYAQKGVTQSVQPSEIVAIELGPFSFQNDHHVDIANHRNYRYQ